MGEHGLFLPLKPPRPDCGAPHFSAGRFSISFLIGSSLKILRGFRGGPVAETPHMAHSLRHWCHQVKCLISRPPFFFTQPDWRQPLRGVPAKYASRITRTEPALAPSARVAQTNTKPSRITLESRHWVKETRTETAQGNDPGKRCFMMAGVGTARRMPQAVSLWGMGSSIPPPVVPGKDRAAQSGAGYRAG